MPPMLQTALAIDDPTFDTNDFNTNPNTQEAFGNTVAMVMSVPSNAIQDIVAVGGTDTSSELVQQRSGSATGEVAIQFSVVLDSGLDTNEQAAFASASLESAVTGGEMATGLQAQGGAFAHTKIDTAKTVANIAAAVITTTSPTNSPTTPAPTTQPTQVPTGTPSAAPTGTPTWQGCITPRCCGGCLQLPKGIQFPLSRMKLSIGLIFDLWQL